MKSIGGYLGLELGPKINTLSDDKHLFNSGRNACLFYLFKYKIKSLYVPYYICGDFIETLKNNEIAINYYHITKDFEIHDDIESTKSVLYVNYFGIKDNYIRTISNRFSSLIIDNSQALFNRPIGSLPTFYSIRKFIGVPDGGLLHTNEMFDTTNIPRAFSYKNTKHLLKQIDKDIESGYEDFLSNERRIVDLPIHRMSKLTHRIVNSVNISKLGDIRFKNYTRLNKELSKYNNLNLDTPSLYTFPLLVDNGEKLRKYLIENRVYTPILWDDQLHIISHGTEWNFINNIVHLPIDQRYNSTDMKKIIKIIKDFYA